MKENDGKHIGNIIDRSTCQKHKADVGEACYTIPSGNSSKIVIGICNKRARSYGFNGKISETSMTKSKSQLKRNKVNGQVR